MARQSSQMVSLAKRGAEVRLREIAREAKILLDLFPHLSDSFDPDELPVQFIIAEGARHAADEVVGPGGRSAAGRRAARARKSWAARRRGEQK